MVFDFYVIFLQYPSIFFVIDLFLHYNAVFLEFSTFQIFLCFRFNYLSLIESYDLRIVLHHNFSMNILDKI